MKQIKVLGTGCKKCVKVADLIQKVSSELDASVEVIKETDPQKIMEYSVMSTPAVVIDEQVVHSGSIPQTDQIKKWLQE